jgi:hypothetical protein
MPVALPEVRVFVSSTFVDMHAERDHLVRTVFPALRDDCRRKLRLELVDVDLRWGISQRDAEDGRTLDICLDEIDTCRPFFLGLLGHRYGWVPQEDQPSITAQEIYHAVLHGFVPRQLTDLRKILEIGTLDDRQRACVVRCYLYDGDRRKHCLKPSTSGTDFSILQSIFRKVADYQQDRSFFFFRSESCTRRLARGDLPTFFEETHRDALARLKQEIVSAGLPHHEYDSVEELGEQVTRMLWGKLEREADRYYSESPVASRAGASQQESREHELFMADRTRYFVGRRRDLDRLHAACDVGNGAAVLLVTGEPGCGKSALLARFAEELTQRHSDWLIVSHFVGATATSTDLRRTLRRFCEHLKQSLDGTQEIPEGLQQLMETFAQLLSQAAERRRVVLVLDAVNQFDAADNAERLAWLPRPLPTGVCLVMSAQQDRCSESLLANAPSVEEIRISGLETGEVSQFVRCYLAEIRRQFPTPEIEAAFLDKLSSGNPLYILVALEELRVFGDFGELAERVASLPSTTDALFDQVLQRLECDRGEQLVERFGVLLTRLRRRVTAEAFKLLLGAGGASETGTQPERLPDMTWSRLYRAFRPYLLERAGRIDFFHGQLQVAVERRYLSTEAKRRDAHQRIAVFCGRWRRITLPELREYSLGYLTFHMASATMWEELGRTLRDPEFLEASRTGAHNITRPVADAARSADPMQSAAARDLILTLLQSQDLAQRRLGVEACAAADWLPPLVQAAGDSRGEARQWATAGLFSVFSRRMHDGDETGARAVVEALRVAARGPLGIPRGAACSALAGISLAILADCGQDPSLFRHFLDYFRGIARDFVPLGQSRNPILRLLRKPLGHFLIATLRPGLGLVLAAGRMMPRAAVSLSMLQEHFGKPRSQREVFRRYIPYLDICVQDLSDLRELTETYCTTRDGFHYVAIIGCTILQGIAQPQATFSILAEMAAKDDRLALYEASRALCYIVHCQRDMQKEPAVAHESALMDWLNRFYTKTDRAITFHGVTIRAATLAREVAYYVARFGRPAAQLDQLVEHAILSRDEGLQQDLLQAFGWAGQQGYTSFAFKRIAVVLQSDSLQQATVRKAVIASLSRMFTRWPTEVTEFLETLTGSGIELDEVAHTATPELANTRIDPPRATVLLYLNDPQLRRLYRTGAELVVEARSVPQFVTRTTRLMYDFLFDDTVASVP